MILKLEQLFSKVLASLRHLTCILCEWCRNCRYSIAVKANTPGRVKLTDLDIEYRLNTRVLDANLEGNLLVPDGIYRNLVVRLAHGDLVDRVTEATIGLNNSYGENPTFHWLRGDTCTVQNDGGGIVEFDVGNYASTTDSEGVVSVKGAITN